MRTEIATPASSGSGAGRPGAGAPAGRAGAGAPAGRAGAAARAGWERGALALVAVSLIACVDGPTRPEPEPAAELELEAKVNVQLGDTPVGSSPYYIVTGYAAAEQGGTARAARIDSVVVEYAYNMGAWTRARRTAQLPFSDDLPITVVAGDVYRLVARLYASAADDAGVRHALMSEWSAAGAARTP